MNAPAPSPLAFTTARRGSIVIAALFLCLAVAGAIGGYIALSMHYWRLAERGLMHNTAVAMAETGAEEALWALNRNDWTSRPWTTSGAFRTLVSADDHYQDVSGNRSSYRVTVDQSDPNRPVILSTGRVVPSSAWPTALTDPRVVKRAIRVEIVKPGGGGGDGGGGPFRHGVVAIEDLTFHNGRVGSYNTEPPPPSGPPPHPPLPPPVAPNPPFADFIDVAGSNTIVATNKSIINKTGVPIIRGQEIVNLDAKLPLVGQPDWWAQTLHEGRPVHNSLPAASGGVITIGDSAAAPGDPPELYSLNEYELPADTTLRVEGPVSMAIAGGFRLVNDNSRVEMASTTSSLQVHVGGNLFVTNNVQANYSPAQSGRPEQLQVYVTGIGDVMLGGNSRFVGAVYAPRSSLTVHGNAKVAGAIVARNVTFNGAVATVVYDEWIKRIAGSPYIQTNKIIRWFEVDIPPGS
jgi:hypothetical protein